LVRLLEFDGRVPEHTERLSHSADLVAAVATRHVDRRVSRRKLAHRRRYPLDWPYHLGNYIPDCDKDRPRQAQNRDEDKQHPAILDSLGSTECRGIAVALRGRDQLRHLLPELQ